ncbi:hypothetical protein SLE2022_318790 [Rubroshorea leprosula]
MEKILEKAENFVDHYRKLEKDMNELQSEFQVLKRRKVDINSRIETEVRLGQVVKEEVKGWLEDVQKMEEDIQDVEERVHSVSRYNRINLDILVREKIEEVKRIRERGNFTEGLVIERARAPGLIFPPEILAGSSKDEIWKNLTGNEVGMMGVCGIGGAGKTTIMKQINNDLLREGRFQEVIWVVVSYPCNVFELQKKIVDAMGQKIQADEETSRAAELTKIMGSRSFVLILDDVWEKYSLEEVGIPKPTVQNGSKVVITSRSVDVCNFWGCKIVKVQPLSPNESLNLFLDKVGLDVLKVEGLGEILNSIVKECNGLPLAIIVIAGSMRGIYDIAEWRTMLDDLQHCVENVEGMEDKIFARLKLSYDRLPEQEIQQCFLYCSLFQEDCEFSRKELIEGWIDEGLIDKPGRQKAYDRGHRFLNKLERNYLLEKTRRLHFVDAMELSNAEAFKHDVEKSRRLYGVDVFKMHDVVRDMAINSIGPGFGYMVKAGRKLTEVPNESGWVGDLKKVSLMDNYISEIPDGLTPNCLLLSTLILSKNNNLSKISSSFFEDMAGLKVLDLSNTRIEALPESISNLVNLSALRLRKCEKLKDLPSLANLRALKKLDLHKAGIEVVPQGLEMLVSIEYLDLFCEDLKEIPTGILPSLSSLQYLGISIAKGINLEEVARLSKLESLKCTMKGIQDFNDFVNKLKSLTAYELRLTTKDEHFSCVRFPDEYQRNLYISRFELGVECIVLPDKLEVLWIELCKSMKNMRCRLNKVVLLEDATELRRCSIASIERIDCLVELDSSSSSSCRPVLDKLEWLRLHFLPGLCELVRVEGVATPWHVFSNLKRLEIRSCHQMRKLLPLELLQALQNIEEIHVEYCQQMEEIIALSGEFTFPKLRELWLWDLPQLKRICSAEGVMVCDSIEKIAINFCGELKRIPLQLPLDNGQPSPPPFLRTIRIVEELKDWWESVVELDQPNAKNILQRYLEFYQWR